MVIKDFTNNNFSVLAYLYDEKNNNNVIKITQDEVAEALNISRVTTNKVFTLFIERGYLQRDICHVGRYVITSLGCNIIETIRCLSVEMNINKYKEN